MEPLKELEHCKLCEWRCGVNRLEGELGTCRASTPVVASCQLHPAPPQSYTIFTAGCNFRCLNCQNYQIAHYPDQRGFPAGFMEPKMLAMEAIAMVNSPAGKRMGADRIFFSGGEPAIHLPYVEQIVKEAREIERNLLEEAVEIAKKFGIESVYWAGRSDIPGHNTGMIMELGKHSIYKLEGARTAGSFALHHGCRTQPRNCGECGHKHACSIKSYKPVRRM